MLIYQNIYKCTPKESLFINDIFMKTNQIFNNIFDDIDYHGYYYKLIDKFENGVTCVRVELLNVNDNYYYQQIEDSHGFLTYNLIKKIDFKVREYNKNIFMTRQQIIENDETLQRQKRIQLIEQENINQPRRQFL